MGHTVIKQPNDKYAIFSSVIDDFIILDANKDELIEFYVDSAREEITERFDRMFGYYDRGQTPPIYAGGPSITWMEAINRRKEIHGNEVEDIVLSK